MPESVAEAGDGLGGATTPKKRRGGLIGLITFPFRAAGAIVRGGIAVVSAVIAVVVFPFKLAWGVTSRLVRLAADIVYAIWRVFAGIAGAIMAVIGFGFRVLDRTVGAVVRLVLRLVRGIVTLPLRAFKIGTKVGVAEATVKTAAATAGAHASATLADVKAVPAKVGRRARKPA